MSYIRNEADILKFVNALISNTKGEGKEGDPFWTKAETLLYTRLSHIEGLSTDELTALLDKDVAVIEIKTAKITIDHKGLGLSQK